MKATVLSAMSCPLASCDMQGKADSILAADWRSKQYHIDIWTCSASVSGGQNQINCEDNLTPNAFQTIIRAPPINLVVDCMLNALAFSLPHQYSAYIQISCQQVQKRPMQHSRHVQ